MKELFQFLSALISGKIAFDGEKGWITMNGTPVKVDDAGEPVAGPSNIVSAEQKHKPTKSVEEKRTAVKDAMQKIASGSGEETIPDLRNDLEQYGGTNDVTIVRGDKKKGLEHIAVRHGKESIPGVLEAVVDGKVRKFVENKKTIHLQKGGYEAVLSLDRNGKKETWLLTGYDVVGSAEDAKKELSGESGKVSARHASIQTEPIFSRLGLGADSSFTGIIAQMFENSTKSILIRDCIAFDRASNRHFDENGFLHVALNPISKEAVNEYYGHEIPGWQEHGLEANRIYKGYRPAPELEKATATFNGLPLLSEHIKDSADDPQKQYRVGNLGTECVFVAPYLKNTLVIQDAEAIKLLNPDDPEKPPKRELSASYRYVPIFEPGVFDNQRYDFVMTEIRGNHVALVEEGRVGSDVVVSDSNSIKGGNKMDFTKLVEKFLNFLKSEMGGESPATPVSDNDPNTTVPAEKTEGTATESTPPANDGDDFISRLMTHISSMEDQDLAAKIKAIIEAVSAQASDNDSTKTANDTDTPASTEGDKPAMDKKPLIKNVANITVAMDANTIIDRIRGEMKEKIEAAKEVRPLIGEIDGLAYDSASGIYKKALELTGFGVKTNDAGALREMVRMAVATRVKASAPVNSALAMDSASGNENFKNLSRIRTA